ncbi:MAG: stage V sporulation protein AC [Clostridia bacterium]|nr:stage V sporulation protein AC [Oscillospiraceae bacterium]MBQ7032310.1 stage V sporulation protein AC [Clostridia bacterium]
MQKTEYKQYAEKHTPDSPMGKNLTWAFLVGGAICTVGQLLGDFFRSRGMEQDAVSAAVSISLIFLSILFTGLDLYDGLAKHAGAGTLVPITGFANAVASPAMEFKTEGYILGLGAKMFVVAGPVITYGVVSSILAGVIYYLFLM